MTVVHNEFSYFIITTIITIRYIHTIATFVIFIAPRMSDYAAAFTVAEGKGDVLIVHSLHLNCSTSSA